MCEVCGLYDAARWQCQHPGVPGSCITFIVSFKKGLSRRPVTSSCPLVLSVIINKHLHVHKKITRTTGGWLGGARRAQLLMTGQLV